MMDTEYRINIEPAQNPRICEHLANYIEAETYVCEFFEYPESVPIQYWNSRRLIRLFAPPLRQRPAKFGILSQSIRVSMYFHNK